MFKHKACIPYGEIFKICKYNLPISGSPKEESGYIPCTHPDTKKVFCSSDCPAKKRLEDKTFFSEPVQ